MNKLLTYVYDTISQVHSEIYTIKFEDNEFRALNNCSMYDEEFKLKNEKIHYSTGLSLFKSNTYVIFI